MSRSTVVLRAATPSDSLELGFGAWRFVVWLSDSVAAVEALISVSAGGDVLLGSDEEVTLCGRDSFVGLDAAGVACDSRTLTTWSARSSLVTSARRSKMSWPFLQAMLASEQ